MVTPSDHKLTVEEKHTIAMLRGMEYAADCDCYRPQFSTIEIYWEDANTGEPVAYDERVKRRDAYHEYND